MASSFAKTWVRPEVYPLVVTMVAAVSLSGFQITRSLTSNPDVRVVKADRSSGLLEDEKFFKEGESFFNHRVRRLAWTTKASLYPSMNEKLGGGSH
jgi:hypothetical protein